MLLEKERKPRSTLKMVIVVELIKGKDDNVRGAIVKVPKLNSLITRPICKLYHIESLRECSDEIVTVNDNTIKERPKRKNSHFREYKAKVYKLANNFSGGSVYIVHKVLSRRLSFTKRTEYEIFVSRVFVIFISCKQYI